MTQMQTPDESRFDRGQRALSDIDGQAGEAVVAALADIAPDFARYLIEFPFGDIYSRPGLDLRSREIATIAALAALGNAAPQLKVHIAAGLNVGLTPDRDYRDPDADGRLRRVPGGIERVIRRERGVRTPSKACGDGLSRHAAYRPRSSNSA
jgi:hypothetical protein